MHSASSQRCDELVGIISLKYFLLSQFNVQRQLHSKLSVGGRPECKHWGLVALSVVCWSSPTCHFCLDQWCEFGTGPSEISRLVRRKCNCNCGREVTTPNISIPNQTKQFNIFLITGLKKELFWLNSWSKRVVFYTVRLHLFIFIIFQLILSNILIIPKELLWLLECNNNHSLQTVEELTSCVKLQGNDFTSSGWNNIFLRSLLQSKCILAVSTPWNFIFQKRLDWSKICMTLHKYCITNKVKEVSYKMIHRVYPVKSV